MNTTLPPIALPPTTQVVFYPFLSYTENLNSGTVSTSFSLGVQKANAEGTVSETDFRVIHQISSCAKSIFASRDPPRQDWLNGWCDAVLQAGLNVYGQIPISTGLTAQSMATLPDLLSSGAVFSLSVPWSLTPDIFLQPTSSSVSPSWPVGAFLSTPLSPVYTSFGEPTVHFCRLASPEEMNVFLNERRQTLSAKGVSRLDSSAGTIFLNGSGPGP